MFAFLIAGLILGVLARTLRGGADSPQLTLTVPVGVVGPSSAARASTSC